MTAAYADLDELWIGAISEIEQFGLVKPARDGEMKEYQGWTGRLEDITRNWVFNPARKASPEYGAGELFWYLSGKRSGDAIKAYAPSYERFLTDGNALGAYGHRWKEQDALRRVFQILSKAPHSQQCVITCWNPSFPYTDLDHAHYRDIPDIPCTLSLQFIRAGDCLNLVATMRSNDAWLGLPYDAYCFTTLQKIFADALGLQYGWYQHQAGSMHRYSRDADKISEALRFAGKFQEHEWRNLKAMSSDGAEYFVNWIAGMVEFERSCREGGNIGNVPWEHLAHGTPLVDALACAAVKWGLDKEDAARYANPFKVERCRVRS